MLLNEFLKEHQILEDQKIEIQALKQNVRELQEIVLSLKVSQTLSH